MKKQKKLKIAAYGFEKIGFDITHNNLLENDISKITSLHLDSTINLSSFDGVIIPNGIFESFKEQNNYISTYIDVYCKRDILLQKEREIINLVNKGGWVCCLVDKIIDEVSYGEYKTKSCRDTDIVKKILNSFNVKRHPFKGSATVRSTNDEFNKYIETYGVAKTILELPYNISYEYKVLAKNNDSIVGIDFLTKFIILPFHTTNFTFNNYEFLVNELSKSLVSYLQKRNNDIPEWVNDFKFNKEIELQEESNNLLEKLKKLQNNLLRYSSYKGILSQSGDHLKDTVVSLLKSFFLLNVTDVEEYKEDAIIRNTSGKEIFVIEVKGTKGGIKRKYINQLDSSRERSGIDYSVPGILIINDQMGIKSIPERHETSVAEEQISHAKTMNIILLRTIDLLFLMKHFENIENRNEQFIALCNNGGGRLVANEEEYKILTQQETS